MGGERRKSQRVVFVEKKKDEGGGGKKRERKNARSHPKRNPARDWKRQRRRVVCFIREGGVGLLLLDEGEGRGLVDGEVDGVEKEKTNGALVL